MKYSYTLLLAILSICLLSCGEQKSKASTDDIKADSTTVVLKAFDYDTLKDIYTGDFGDSPITIGLTFASEGHATGFNVVRGKRRNISGKVQRFEDHVLLTLAEPGDDENDGVFKIKMFDNDLSVISGEWESKKGEVKNFSLTKRVFDNEDYDKNDFSKYGEVFSDSLGTMYFDSDGTVKYEYYENEGAANEQQRIVNGSWKFSNMSVAVFWQPNSIFPLRKSTFLLDPEKEIVVDGEDDYKQRELRGENRILTAYMF